MRFYAYLFTAVLLTQSIGVVQATAAAPKPDLSSMNYFVGSWTCKRTKNPDKSRIGTTLHFTVANDSAGAWMVVNGSQGKTYVTQDPKTKRWISEFVGSNGDYGAGESMGWSGNTMVWKDTITSGGDPLGSQTFTKTSATSYTSNYVQAGKTYASVCNKS